MAKQSGKQTGKQKSVESLGRRERQIMDVIFALNEASVSDVLNNLEDAPSYSSVRTMIRHLESKGFLKHREEGRKYIYSPTQRRDRVRKSALNRVLQTFFAGSATDAVASLLGDPSEEFSDDELDRLQTLIDQARKEGK